MVDNRTYVDTELITQKDSYNNILKKTYEEHPV